MRRTVAVATAAFAVLAWSAAPSPAAVSRVVSGAMIGAQEVPPADPDGFGTAVFSLESDLGRVCYLLTVFNIAPATAAHIHVAPRGSNSPIVVPLVPPTNGSSGGCATVSMALAQAIAANPSQYYVNVHNPVYPGGAIRAQLR